MPKYQIVYIQHLEAVGRLLTQLCAGPAVIVITPHQAVATVTSQAQMSCRWLM